jgi:hypothetical protein
MLWMHLFVSNDLFFEAERHFLMTAGANALNESMNLAVDLVDFVELLTAMKIVLVLAVLHVDKTLALSLLGLQLLCRLLGTFSLSS